MQKDNNITFESLMAYLHETAEISRKEAEKGAERHAKIELLMAKNAKAIAEIHKKHAEAMAESEKKHAAESEKRRAEIEKMMAKHVKEMEFLRASQIETDRIVKENAKQLGGLSASHGSFAEELFLNAVELGDRKLFGQKFDKFRKNVKGLIVDAEYDALLENCVALGIIEIKYKAQLKHLQKILEKVNTFRINFPHLQNHQIYLGLASFIFEEDVENACINLGIAVIKQKDDIYIVNDSSARAF